MCINPRRLNNGAEVWCRKCWQCQANSINDWVGRCIAESRTAIASHSVTLTYGRDANDNPDHERAAVLTYSDVQKWLKLLRFHGYPLRYFVVGEFGSAKGRTHWHAIVFWLRKVPPLSIRQRVVQAHWAHGWSFFDDVVNPSSVRYVCKYIQKDLGAAERQKVLGMSKVPPLGAAYFRDLARAHARQGLGPGDGGYTFPDNRDRNGQLVRHRLRGASLDLYLAEYLKEWERTHPGQHAPESDLLNAYADRHAGFVEEVRPQPFKPRSSRPWLSPPGDAEPFFSEPHNCWAVELDGQTLFWSFNLEGKRAWQNVIRTEAQADMLRLQAEARAAAYATQAALTKFRSR